jgi:hypothetical protein
MNAVTSLHDARHERRIQRLGKACIEAHAAGDLETASTCWEQMRLAIAERSPEQVRRLEASMGRRARRRLKVWLMTAFLQGWMPAAIVVAAFRLLHLGGL